jgi:hypothetical protein
MESLQLKESLDEILKQLIDNSQKERFILQEDKREIVSRKNKVER